MPCLSSLRVPCTSAYLHISSPRTPGGQPVPSGLLPWERPRASGGEAGRDWAERGPVDSSDAPGPALLEPLQIRRLKQPSVSWPGLCVGPGKHRLLGPEGLGGERPGQGSQAPRLLSGAETPVSCRLPLPGSSYRRRRQQHGRLHTRLTVIYRLCVHSGGAVGPSSDPAFPGTACAS